MNLNEFVSHNPEAFELKFEGIEHKVEQNKKTGGRFAYYLITVNKVQGEYTKELTRPIYHRSTPFYQNEWEKLPEELRAGLKEKGFDPIHFGPRKEREQVENDNGSTMSAALDEAGK